MTPHVSKTIIKVSEDKTSWVVSDQLAITLGVFKFGLKFVSYGPLSVSSLKEKKHVQHFLQSE